MKKKFLSIILTFAMVVTMIPMFGITASATQDTVYYLNASGNLQNCDNYTEVIDSSSTVNWSSGTYVVKGNVNINVNDDYAVFVNGEVNLILLDGAKLTIENTKQTCSGISYSSTGKINIFSGTTESGFTPLGTGVLETTGDFCGIILTYINIYGGTVIANGGSSNVSKGIAGYEIVVKGGTIYAKGGEKAVYAENALTIDDAMEITGTDDTYSTGTTTSLSNNGTDEYVTISDGKTPNACKYLVPLAAGKHLLFICNKEAGEYTITGNAYSGFKIQDSDSKYIANVAGEVKAQDTAFIWKFDGGLYTGNGCSKQYLAYDSTDKKFILSNYRVVANIQQTSEEHTFTYQQCEDNKHQAICVNCGYRGDAATHTYDENTHRCICGKFDPDEATLINSAFGSIIVSIAAIKGLKWISKLTSLKFNPFNAYWLNLLKPHKFWV